MPIKVIGMIPRKGHRPTVTKYKYKYTASKPKKQSAPTVQKKTPARERPPLPDLARPRAVKNMQRDSRGRIELKTVRGYVANAGGKKLVSKSVRNKGKPNKPAGKLPNVKNVPFKRKGTVREREVFDEIMRNVTPT